MKVSYAALLEDKDVKRWYDNLAAKSDLTATVYIRTLRLYCDLNKTTPKKILKVSKTKKFRDDFTDFIRELEKQGKAGSYIARFKKVVMSWLSYNGINVKLKVNIAGEYDTPTIANERIPNKDELNRIFRSASKRGRVSIALMAYGGLRPESLGNYSGTDGLRLGDLEAEINKEGLSFKLKPSKLTVRKSLSKSRYQYFTFLPDEATKYINEHLEERIKRNEVLNVNSPVLGFDPRGIRTNKFLRTTLVTRDIKEAITKAGFNWRPYVLRAYFDTNLIMAEAKGKISHPYLQFMMGHKGDIEARYSTKKGILPPDMIEDLRKTYQECEPYLTSATIHHDQNDLIKQAKLESLKSIAKNIFGIDLQDILHQKEIEDKIDLTPETELETIEDALKQFREGTTVNTSEDEDALKKFREGYKIPSIGEDKSESKLVTEDELEDYLNNGWEMIQIINSKILIRKRIQ
ncbi:MAG: site-specific integrase [Candidatus Bathyarchaeota archaeon]|nr:site-specific integrase [Candidatus Bathyarchaeota archaeon]